VLRVVESTGARHHGHARALRRPPGDDLVADGLHDVGGRADEHEARLRARRRQARVLGQEPVPRVDRVGARLDGGLDDPIHPQVAVAGGCGADLDRPVRDLRVHRAAVGLGADRDRLDPQVAAGADHADRDLPAVGDEDAARARPAETASPSAIWNVPTVPPAGAGTSRNCFITSTTPTTAPASTVSPSSTKGSASGLGRR
jgi:hypothetical protein